MRYEYETKVMHPALEKNLRINKIPYSREVPMSLYGRLDFIIYLPAVTYITECKRDCAEIRKAIAQVLLYKLQYQAECKPMIVVPKGTVTQIAQQLCDKWDVVLAKMEFPTSDEYLLDKIMSNGHSETPAWGKVKWEITKEI